MYQTTIKMGFVMVGLCGLTACQTVATPKQTDSQTLNQQDSKQILSNAIKKTLYHRQTWLSEHQVYLKNQNTENSDTTDTAESSNTLEACQVSHDKQLIAQMKADNLTNYADISDLAEDKQAIYTKIKQQYLDCYHALQAKNTEIDYLTDTITDESTDKKSNDNNELIENMDELGDIVSYMGLSKEQVNSLNQFMLKSGKIITTGSYHPLSRTVAVQVDAGFENKNLKYHYRLPVVADLQQQSVYVKPDIIMPTIALYLDNQMGMSWKDKWYKFDIKKDEHLPADMTLKAWTMAIKSSFDELPTSQFRTIDSVLLMPNIAYATQKIAKNGTVIKWQQTAKEQENLYQDVVEHFIQNMDDNIEKAHNDAYKAQWQTYKTKLNDKLETRLAIEPDDSNRLTGQQLYFVVANGQIKQIFAEHSAKSQGQAFKLNTWITFSPDESLIKPTNQPKTLNQLADTIKDSNGENSNVIDGRAEIQRLVKLDDSRRLFGREPEWLKQLGKLVDINVDEDDDEY